jgi:uncharacterized membrane protein YdjX (TVP38/TMEM64 family)
LKRISTPSKNNGAAREKILRVLPAALVAAFAVYLLLSGKNFSVQTVLDFTPEKPVLAAAVMLLLYAVKSLTVVFPLIALFAASGFLFPWYAAIGLNILGLSVTLTLPYLIGRRSGRAAVDRIAAKHPKFASIMSVRRGGDFFFSFITRAVGVLSCDAVSMYMGAVGVPYRVYLPSALLGFLPNLVLVTLLGENAGAPSSPGFIVTLVTTIAFPAASCVFYYFYLKKRRDGGAK